MVQRPGNGVTLDWSGISRRKDRQMVWVFVVIVVAALGYAFWWLAKRSSDVDEDLRAMNEGRTNGPGIFGIFRKDRRS
jgi:hypothetical protein